MNLMAVEIPLLSAFSLEDQERILKKLVQNYASEMIAQDEAEKQKWTYIEIDGETFRIHDKVNDLLNSVYKMYEKELKKEKD